ncbi:MAG: cytochrome c maturation protein CcmE [Chloroflexota bacterium]|nr:cytochrome c maturation protein CcmE [Chloroflexota bacterium]
MAASTALAEETSRRSYRFALIALVIASAVGLLIYLGMRSTTVYYMQVGELLSKGSQAQNQQVRVAGKVVPGSIQRQGTELRFVAADKTGKVSVSYSGVVPDIFADNADVVVEGRYMPSGRFEANTLLAKCPSKFESKPGTTASDMRR